MKITRSQLKQIIKEEVENLPIENLIGGINGLVQGMDPELVGVVFTTVFKDIENSGPSTEPEATGEPEEVTPIGFGREPEQLSDKEPGQIGFEEEIERIIKEELKAVIGESDRTAKGNVTQDARNDHATLSDGRFPIFDRKSALAALKLRGHGTTAAERKKIINKAAKYAKAEAEAAREADKKD